MKIIKTLSLVIFVIGGFFFSVTTLSKPEIPEDGSRYYIIGQDLDSIRDYMNDEELPRPNGFTVYTTLTRGATEPATNYCFKGLDGLKNLNNYRSNSASGCPDNQRRNSWGSGIQNAEEIIARYSPNLISIGMFCPGPNEAPGLYQNNTHDDLLSELADFFKQHASIKFFLRTCYEFNGDAHGFRGQEQEFVRTFQYVRNFLDGQSVTNVAHVWQSDAFHSTNGFWPGREFVDWVGVSQFNSDIDEEVSRAQSENLPLFIAEATPHGELGVQFDFSIPFGSTRQEGVGSPNPVTVINNTSWFDDIQGDVGLTVHKAWAYINADWTSQPQWSNAPDQAGLNFFTYTDSRVQLNTQIKERFRSLVSSQNGFLVNDNLNGDVSPTPAPTSAPTPTATPIPSSAPTPTPDAPDPVTPTATPQPSNFCPVSHPFECGGRCFVDENQARSGGCS